MQNKITISKGEETEGIGKSNFLHHLAKNKLTRKFTEALKGLIKMTGGFSKQYWLGPVILTQIVVGLFGIFSQFETNYEISKQLEI